MEFVGLFNVGSYLKILSIGDLFLKYLNCPVKVEQQVD